MNDQQFSAQPQSSAASYVDAYDPQSATSAAPTDTPTGMPNQPIWSTPPVQAVPQPGPVISETPFTNDNPFARPVAQPQSMQTEPAVNMAQSSDTNRDFDSAGSMATPTVSNAEAEDIKSEALEDQNIFDLLGVGNVNDEEKEAFLDELQQVIWEDFLENDVELLLTSEEIAALKQLMGDRPKNDPQFQEEVITFLEKYVPDLEDIMLEKALELKEDMVRERLAGLREYFAGQSDKLAQLDKAEQLMTDAQWRSSAEVMNQLLS